MKSKLLQYWETEVKNAKNRLSRAERYYLECQESSWKYICNFGFISKDLEERTKNAFLNAGKMFIQYQNIVEKFRQVKGNMGIVYE